MSPANLHMLINYLPIGSIVIGLPVILYGIISKKKDVILIALGIFVFAGLTAVAAYLTGKGAEEVVGNLPGASETLIHIHQRTANLFLAFSAVLGIIATVSLVMIRLKARFVIYFHIGLIVISVFALVAAIRVGNTGRQIRHTEVRTGERVIQFQSEN